MNRKLWLAAPVVFVAVIALLWFTSSDEARVLIKRTFGLEPPKSAASQKPLCSQVVVPVGDCIPQHLANLPPDPGPAGMKTIEGIDADKDGVRDDVQRYIAENWGNSERAVRALNNLARVAQLEILAGDSVSREQARSIGDQITQAANCFQLSVDDTLRFSRAPDKVHVKMVNTPERYRRWDQFERLLIGVYPLNTAPVQEQCGYDPAALPS